MSGARGFTLIEALAALAATGAVLLALGEVAGQWLPHWRHGFAVAQNADLVAQSLDRLAADLSAAEFARIDPGHGPPAFKGDAEAVIFVRADNGPNATPRLEYVRVGPVATPQGAEVRRASAPFAPGPLGGFGDAATLLRPPFRIAFAYQAPQGGWVSSWGTQPTLPRAVRVTVFNGAAVVAATAFELKAPFAPDLSATKPAQLPKPQDEGRAP